MKTATLIVRLADTGDADQRVYSLSVPVQYHDFVADADRETDHVLVSSLPANFFRPAETYIFPSTPAGNVLYWGELRGSFKGGMDHTKALRGLGYSVVENES